MHLPFKLKGFVMTTLSKKHIKILCTIASSILIFIGLFHGSGIVYINGMVQESDVSNLVKNVFPILFISPSIQLIGIGIIGFFAVTQHYNYRILLTLSILVLINACFAFFLNALIPGIILLTSSFMYSVVAWRSKTLMNN